VLEEGEQLADDALALGGLVAADGGGDAGVQVIFQEEGVDPADGALDSLELLDNVHAVRVFFNHLDDAADVAVDAFEAVENLGAAISCRHLESFELRPQGGGVWIHSITRGKSL